MLKALDSLLFYVTDSRTTVKFYKTLGFDVVEDEDGRGVVKLKDFFLHFHDKGKEDKPKFREEALAEPKGAGLYIYIGVDDVDGYYKSLIRNGLKPSTEPRDWPWGREFVIKDPDRYKIVIYQPLK